MQLTSRVLSCSLSLWIITPPPSTLPRLRPHATLSHCTVAPLPQISLHASFLLLSTHLRRFFHSPSSSLASLVLLAERSSQHRVMLKYQLCALLLKRVIAVSPQLSASLCNILPLGLLSALFMDSGALHLRTRTRTHARQRQVRDAALHCANPHRLHLPCSIACSLDLLSHLSRLQSRPRHIQNPNIISVLFVSLSLSPSLMLATWLLSDSYRLTPSSLLPPYSYHISTPLP